MQPDAAPPLLLDLGLFLTIALIGLALSGEGSGLKLAVAVHMWLRVYDRRFAGWRKVSWLAVVVGQFLLVAVGFLAYLLPWGQAGFWIMTKLGDLGPWVASHTSLVKAIVGLLTWVVLIVDMVALHAGRTHSRKLWRIGWLLFAAFVIVVAGRDVMKIFSSVPSPPPTALPTPAHILPDIGMLSYYAILRAVPDKTFGVALLSVVLLLPAVAGFTRPWRFHAPATRARWAWLAAGLAASWLGLILLGDQPANVATQWSALTLIAYQVAFYLVVPFALARALQRDENPASVFE